MKKENESSESILLPEAKKIVYGGEQLTVNTLGIRQIMELLKIVSRSEKQIRQAIANEIVERRNV